MLIEVWDHSETRGVVNIFTPAWPSLYPRNCRNIADADWRYALRFGGCRAKPAESTVPPQLRLRFPPQTLHQFDAAAGAAVLAMADPYQEQAGAG